MKKIIVTGATSMIGTALLEDMYPFLSKEELEENMFTETNGEMQ